MSERNSPIASATGSCVITRPEDIRTAAMRLDAAARAVGLRVGACADIASAEQMTCADGASVNAEVFGWTRSPERWWERRRLALSSPLPRACRYESEPFWCNEEGLRTRWPNRYLDGIDLTDFRRRALLPAAIIVPVHLPFGQIGAVSFSPQDRSKTDLSEEFAAHADALAVLARQFVASYVGLRRAQQWMPADCHLSEKEVACLRWAAMGKTDREVGAILSLSHATVRYHLQRAGERLNAVNRSQTIFKAGQLGYLQTAT